MDRAAACIHKEVYTQLAPGSIDDVGLSYSPTFQDGSKHKLKSYVLRGTSLKGLHLPERHLVLRWKENQYWFSAIGSRTYGQMPASLLRHHHSTKVMEETIHLAALTYAFEQNGGPSAPPLGCCSVQLTKDPSVAQVHKGHPKQVAFLMDPEQGVTLNLIDEFGMSLKIMSVS